MRYTPKYKLNLKFTSEGFIIKSTGENYVGPYIETSTKKYYAGHDQINFGPELEKQQEETNNIRSSLNNDKFSILKKRTYLKLKKHENIPGSKNIPTEEDYDRGYFIRYYLVRANDDNYLEINKKIYDKYLSDKKIDEALYSIQNIKWALKGNVIEINSNMLKLQERVTPGVTRIFPIYNEFERIAIYDIKGRSYPDLEEISPLLPPSYDLPKVAIRKCQNCFFNKNLKCGKWKAEIRSNYWCKSWAAFNKAKDKELIDSFGSEEEFNKYFNETLNSLYLPPPGIKRPVEPTRNPQQSPSRGTGTRTSYRGGSTGRSSGGSMGGSSGGSSGGGGGY